jgi:hypothetical protein
MTRHTCQVPTKTRQFIVFNNEKLKIIKLNHYYLYITKLYLLVMVYFKRVAGSREWLVELSLLFLFDKSE